ncbi:MAG: leucine zipper domain-containing protein, partial [Thermoanaerobaculia bacterium]
VLVRRVLRQGWSVPEAAEAAGLSTRTAYKWLQRYKAEGLSGLADQQAGERPHRELQYWSNLHGLLPSVLGTAPLISCRIPRGFVGLSTQNRSGLKGLLSTVERPVVINSASMSAVGGVSGRPKCQIAQAGPGARCRSQLAPPLRVVCPCPFSRRLKPSRENWLVDQTFGDYRILAKLASSEPGSCNGSRRQGKECGNGL